MGWGVGMSPKTGKEISQAGSREEVFEQKKWLQHRPQGRAYLAGCRKAKASLGPRETAAAAAAAAAAAKLLQSCPTLCNPKDGSPSGSSIPGILQARILEWIAISFSYACMHAKSFQSRMNNRRGGQRRCWGKWDHGLTLSQMGHHRWILSTGMLWYNVHFKNIFIYLAVPGLGCKMWDPQSSLQHMGSCSM